MMNQIVTTALERISKARPEPGTYRGKATLSIAFDYKVGEPHEAKVAAAVPWQSLAAVLFSKLNAVTRVSIADLVKEAIEGEGEVDEAGVKREAQEAVAALVGATKRTVQGRCTGSAMILEVAGFELLDEAGDPVEVETVEL